MHIETRSPHLAKQKRATGRQRGLAGLCAGLALLIVATTSKSSGLTLQSDPEAAAQLMRPTDAQTWVTLGTTLRLRTDGSGLPDEMRHVQVRPDSYARFRRDGHFPNGATFIVTFHGLKADPAHSPERNGEPALLAQTGERFVGVEVLDSNHSEGRRFYSFPGGVTQTSALPPGNTCATCHRKYGDSQGLFTQHYPATRTLWRDVK